MSIVSQIKDYCKQGKDAEFIYNEINQKIESKNCSKQDVRNAIDSAYSENKSYLKTLSLVSSIIMLKNKFSPTNTKEILDQCIDFGCGLDYLKNASLPYEGNAHDGVFNFLRARANGTNPYDAGLVGIQSDGRCPMHPKSIFDYGCHKPWYIREEENNTLTFEFKKGTLAMNGYTIRSGHGTSYWNNPTSFAWEGSNDNSNWEMIDEKRRNMDIGANDKTYTWTCSMSKPFKFIRFRLMDVTKSGGHYTEEIELFGFYEGTEVIE